WSRIRTRRSSVRVFGSRVFYSEVSRQVADAIDEAAPDVLDSPGMLSPSVRGRRRRRTTSLASSDDPLDPSPAVFERNDSASPSAFNRRGQFVPVEPNPPSP